MTESDMEYQQYIDRLHSNYADTVIKAAHALGDLGDRRAVPILIDLLQTTPDPSIRNAAAVGLRELGDDSALHPLIALIMSPKTEQHRGTLIYALEGFDSSPVLEVLVDLVITGNFEVSHQAFSVIESIETVVSEETLNRCLQNIHSVLPKCDKERTELLEELIELLSEMKYQAECCPHSIQEDLSMNS